MPREKILRLFHWYDRYLSPVAFLFGFILDSLTLTRIDLLLDNIILLTHLAIAATGIVLINAFEAGKIRNESIEKFSWIIPLMTQFSFGALFSGFVVLFWRSGSLAGSWIFLFLLVLFLVGNEFFRERYRRINFHISVYYIALFSYAILALPILFRSIAPGVFIASGAVSLAAIAGFIFLLQFLVHERVVGNKKTLAKSIGGIFLAFNALYFLNIIPPIPLALRDLDIYHSIERTSSNTYRVTYEKAPWYTLLETIDGTFRWKRGTEAVAYSAVFTPTEINIIIFHHWLYYDEESSEWVEKSRIKFPISGGREGGYRGYTIKRSLEPGKWRVEVRTERGQLLGRKAFEVVEVPAFPPLETKEL